MEPLILFEKGFSLFGYLFDCLLFVEWRCRHCVAVDLKTSFALFVGSYCACLRVF